MKTLPILFGALFLPIAAWSGILPVITAQPTNIIVAPSATATFSVSAPGATSYQWRFNGTNIAGATSSTLMIASAQSTNVGYYIALVGNDTGWTPSQLAYLSVVPSPGASLTLSNWLVLLGHVYVNSNAIADYQSSSAYGQPITNGTAQIVAGPALDQMQPVGTTTPVTNGYFRSTPIVQSIPSLAAGQTIYYRVDVSYLNDIFGTMYTQPSTVLKLIAGGGTFPIPATDNLRFPLFPEWPEPSLVLDPPPTNVVLLPGQTFTLNNAYSGFGDYGQPTLQWRKDGHYISGQTNFTCDQYSCGIQTTLTITNVQVSDAGVYDAEVLGDYWFIGPKTYLSVVTTTNTQSVLRSPRIIGSNFVCDVDGAPAHNYTVLYSTNLATWYPVLTLSNATGIVTFSNALSSLGARYYRCQP